MTSIIARVEAVDVRVPLPHPLQLGAMRIEARGYAVVTVTTDDGLTGHAIALNRDTPVAAAVNGVLARAIVGTPADRVGEAWERMFDATIAAGRVGTVMRGLSLVDIALWDVKGKRAGLPVWSLLGGARASVGVAIVGGYPRADLRPEEVGERVAAYSHDGYDVIKIARAPDNAVTRRILQTARDGLRSGARLVVDAAWVHRTPEQALREVAEWGDVPIAWLEDPMPPENVEACARLARRAPVPIGYGDEITDEHLMTRLMQAEALGVVRVDATDDRRDQRRRAGRQRRGAGRAPRLVPRLPGDARPPRARPPGPDRDRDVRPRGQPLRAVEHAPGRRPADRGRTGDVTRGLGARLRARRGADRPLPRRPRLRTADAAPRRALDGICGPRTPPVPA